MQQLADASLPFSRPRKRGSREFRPLPRLFGYGLNDLSPRETSEAEAGVNVARENREWKTRRNLPKR